MGETTDGGLYEIFQQDYGPVGSSSFETAREMFMISSAGYAVASLLLQPKDRHNGNLLFDKYAFSFFAMFVVPCIFWELQFVLLY
jgi:phosphatidylinositol 4-kinase A